MEPDASAGRRPPPPPRRTLVDTHDSPSSKVVHHAGEAVSGTQRCSRCGADLRLPPDAAATGAMWEPGQPIEHRTTWEGETMGRVMEDTSPIALCSEDGEAADELLPPGSW